MDYHKLTNMPTDIDHDQLILDMIMTAIRNKPMASKFALLQLVSPAPTPEEKQQAAVRYMDCKELDAEGPADGVEKVAISIEQDPGVGNVIVRRSMSPSPPPVRNEYVHGAVDTFFAMLILGILIWLVVQLCIVFIESFESVLAL